jgi:predicted metal-dependent phosphoesterase TrpH
MLISTDLHSHSLYSDARSLPGALIRCRAEHGLRVVALTDHDVFAGCHAAASAAESHGMVLVPGAEITSVLHFGTEDAEQIHVLAYFPPSHLHDGRLERTFLHQRGMRVQERWRDFVLEWIDDRTHEERARIDPGRSLTYVHASGFPGLQLVIDRIVRAAPESFQDFRKHHVRFWLEDRDLFGWSPEEMIDAIRADGALDVVAHPVRYKDKDRLDAILRYASGVEAYTSRHNARVAERFRAYAEEHEKHWTASTDDHQQQPYQPPASGTPVSTLERILQAQLPNAEPTSDLRAQP